MNINLLILGEKTINICSPCDHCGPVQTCSLLDPAGYSLKINSFLVIACEFRSTAFFVFVGSLSLKQIFCRVKFGGSMDAYLFSPRVAFSEEHYR